jgi:hypothetical protein
MMRFILVSIRRYEKKAVRYAALQKNSEIRCLPTPLVAPHYDHFGHKKKIACRSAGKYKVGHRLYAVCLYCRIP